MVKIAVPQRDTARDEITVLRLANGDGCAAPPAPPPRAARSSSSAGAPLCDLGPPPERRLEVLCDAASRVPPPRPGAGCGAAPRGALTLIHRGEAGGDRAAVRGRRTVVLPLACVVPVVVSHDDERAVLPPGDVHQWTVLADPRSARSTGGWKLVDPPPPLAEAEYDLGTILMREDPRSCTATGAERALARSAHTGTERCFYGSGACSSACLDRSALHADRAPAGRARDARGGGSAERMMERILFDLAEMLQPRASACTCRIAFWMRERHGVAEEEAPRLAHDLLARARHDAARAHAALR